LLAVAFQIAFALDHGAFRVVAHREAEGRHRLRSEPPTSRKVAEHGCLGSYDLLSIGLALYGFDALLSVIAILVHDIVQPA
jgi:hypothetical protein